MEEQLENAAPEPVKRGWKRPAMRFATVGLAGVVLLMQAVQVARDPSIANLAVAAVFVLLAAAIALQIVLLRSMGNRRVRRAMSRLHGSAYISDLEGLPNRNYLLSEIRREMPRARGIGIPFVVVVLSLDTIDEVRSRRGEEFAERATRGMADVLKRFTRTSDFIGHLGGARFAVLLNECRYEDSFIYLKRVPGSIAVSDGRTMYEVPVAARVHQYDLEALYATDVLNEAEQSQPLRRKQTAQFGSIAA